MLSQIEVLPEAPTTTAKDVETHIAIDVWASPTLSFEVSTPQKDVRVDPKDTSVLIISPGSYFLDFTILDDTFLNPAIILNTPFGPFSIPRTGLKTATLSDTNNLKIGEGEQVFSFRFLFASGPIDPTIVNTPDPA
jgi:hypothetical protein